MHTRIINKSLDDSLLASCQRDYEVAEDKGAAMRFLMRSGEISWNPASATVRKK